MASAHRPIAVIGPAGGAGGRALRESLCKSQPLDQCAQEAVVQCRATSLCDTVEVRLMKQPHCRGCVYTLREAYITWVPPDSPPTTRRKSLRIKACGRLAQQARLVGLGSNLTRAIRSNQEAWRAFFCEEYAGTPSQQPPLLGARAPLVPQPGASGTVYCPQNKPGLHVFTYSNRQTGWLCAFLRSAAFSKVPVTVIGWSPDISFIRPDRVWYFIDRIYTWLRYLSVCRSALHPNATLLLADNDQLFVTSQFDEVHAKLSSLMQRRRASVVISAESSCAPRKLNNKSWVHSRRELPGVDFGDSHSGHWRAGVPFCLNSGNIAGTPAAIVDLLNRTCRACQKGWTLQRVFEHFTRSYAEDLTGWIYSEQREIMKMFLQASSAQTGWILDYHQEIFHSSSGLQASAVKEMRNGRIQNKITNTKPAIVHYNGDSRESWSHTHSPAARLHRLQRVYIRRRKLASEAAAETAVAKFVREQVRFLGNDFVPREVAFGAAAGGICTAGLGVGLSRRPCAEKWCGSASTA